MISNRIYGIGGSCQEIELEKLTEPTSKPEPIQEKEFQDRIKNIRKLV